MMGRNVLGNGLNNTSADVIIFLEGGGGGGGDWLRTKFSCGVHHRL